MARAFRQREFFQRARVVALPVDQRAGAAEVLVTNVSQALLEAGFVPHGMMEPPGTRRPRHRIR